MTLKRSIKTYDHGLILIAGSFAPAGTSAPTDVKGMGFSVARSGVGEYTITLDEKYSELVSACGQVQMNTATDLNLQVEDYVAASKTLVIQALAGATPTEIAANADNRVHFQLVVKKSDV